MAKINYLLRQYFGLGILIVIATALLFPYMALTLYPAAALFLFILMFIAGISTDWGKLKIILHAPKKVLMGNVIIYFAVPAIITVLAYTFLSTGQYIYGVIFASLTPAAIVAPFFTGLMKGNRELSFGILISSTIISPFIIPPMLTIFAGDILPISTILLLKNMLLLITLPLIIAITVKIFFKKTSLLINKNAPILNFSFLSLLIFILFGVSSNKFGLGYGNYTELWWVLVIFFIQDFFLIILWRYLKKQTEQPQDWIAVILSGSMKNIAIAASLLLIYDPAAAIAPALGFVAHSFLYTPFVLQKLMNK